MRARVGSALSGCRRLFSRRKPGDQTQTRGQTGRFRVHEACDRGSAGGLFFSRRAGPKPGGGPEGPAPQWLCLLAALGLLACAPASAQEPAVIRVNVDLVRVLATVKNGSGEPVGTLQKSDFEIYDNGRRQELALFEHHTEQPLSISLLVDISGSTARELKYETESVARFLKALFAEGNPADAVALYTFNWQVTLQNSFTRNHGSLEHSLRNLKAEAGTSLYDAIYLGARDLEDRDGRHVMVIVTDGGDTTSSKDFHAALQSAQLADAVIYPILVMPITNDAGRNIGGENALATMAAGTGGRVFSPGVGPDLDAAFSEIIRELRTQYLLGYYPKDVPLSGNRFHKLELKLSRPGLRVSARNGYYGEAEGNSGERRRER